MAGVVDFTGFDTGDTIETTTASGIISVQNSVVYSGGYALQVNPTGTGVGSYRIGLRSAAGVGAAASVATAYARVHFRVGTLPATADEEFVNFVDSSLATKFSVRINSSGILAAYDSTPTLLATGTTVLSVGNWYCVEWTAGTGTSGVSWAVRIGGNAEISGSGANTNANNNAHVRVGKQTNRNGNTVNYYYDDLIWRDDTWCGDGQCKPLLPAANGTYQTATIGAGTGAHYTIVDDLPSDGDTSYLVTDNVSGDAETEAMQTRSAAGLSVASVNSVKPLCYLKRDGTSGGSVKQRLRSGSTNGDSNAFATTASYTLAARIFNTDPATAAAWLVPALDSLECGVLENQAAGNKSRLTAAYVMVDYVPVVAGGRPLRLGTGGGVVDLSGGTY